MGIDWLDSMNLQRMADNSEALLRNQASKDRQIKEVVDKYNDLLEDYSGDTAYFEAHRDFYRNVVEENIEKLSYSKEELAAKSKAIADAAEVHARQEFRESLRQKQSR